jgi:hypothetical protein
MLIVVIGLPLVSVVLDNIPKLGDIHTVPSPRSAKRAMDPLRSHHLLSSGVGVSGRTWAAVDAVVRAVDGLRAGKDVWPYQIDGGDSRGGNCVGLGIGLCTIPRIDSVRGEN